MAKAYKSADERVYESDLADVVAVLVGSSPWQKFIDWGTVTSRSPSDRFRIVSSKDFNAVMVRLNGEGNFSSTPGVTDKQLGKVVMQEFFGINSQSSYLEASLHELVHLSAHQPGRADQPKTGSPVTGSTAVGFVRTGLNEAFVELITQDILKAQGIALASPSKQGYLDSVPVAKEIFADIDVGLLGDLIFKGRGEPFRKRMEELYSFAGWTEIKGLTSSNKPARALDRVKFWRADTLKNKKPLPKGVQSLNWTFR